MADEPTTVKTSISELSPEEKAALLSPSLLEAYNEPPVFTEPKYTDGGYEYVNLYAVVSTSKADREVPKEFMEACWARELLPVDEKDKDKDKDDKDKYKYTPLNWEDLLTSTEYAERFGVINEFKKATFRGVSIGDVYVFPLNLILETKRAKEIKNKDKNVEMYLSVLQGRELIEENKLTK